MQTNLEKVESDHSTEWLALSAKIRTLASRLNEKARGTDLEADTAEFTSETSQLCDQLDRIYRDVGNLLTELEVKPPEMNPSSPTVELDAVQREAIQIHRETHELRADFKDIIKALFMWQDDPTERVQRKS